MKPNESVLSSDIVDFLGQINVAENCEDAFEMLIGYSEGCGFPVVIYEYCDDVTNKDQRVFMRSNLPDYFTKLERIFKGKEESMPGRMHAKEHLTPGFAGLEFVDMYEGFPLYPYKMRLAKLLTGLRSGFGVPLRTHNPNARAGLGFGSKLDRQSCEAQVKKHGANLTIAALNTHTKILQLQSQSAARTNFTPKQIEYLKLLCDGLLDKQISQKMGISHSGVRKYHKTISRKLGVSQRSSIVKETMNLGILSDVPNVAKLHQADIWDMEINFEPRA